MSIWNFPPVTFPAGTLKTTVYNSDGQSTVFNESGDWLLNISPLVESVERSGAGCELRTDEITLEMYDRGNLFRQHIFTSQAYCLLLLNVGGTDYTFYHGRVDFDNVEYESCFDTGDTAETLEVHTVKFSVMSMLRELENPGATVGWFAPTISLTIDASTPSHYYGVRIATLYVQILQWILQSVPRLVVQCNLTSSQLCNITFTRGSTDYNLFDIYISFAYGTARTDYTYLWEPTGAWTFQNTNNLREFAALLASQFFLYPILQYTPASGTSDGWSFKLKPRGNSAIGSDQLLGLVKSSVRSKFVGYAAVRSYNHGYGISGGDRQCLPNMTDAQFDSISSLPTMDLDCMMEINQKPSGGDDEIQLRVAEGNLLKTIDSMRIENSSPQINTTSLSGFQVQYADRAWNPSPDGYERVYQGVGIGTAHPLEILDVFEITTPYDALDCTAIEIRRDLMKNEMTVKWVAYPAET